MLGALLAKVIGTQNERELKRVAPLVAAVNGFEPSIRELSAEGLRAKTVEFRERLGAGETLDDLLPEAFAVVREAGRRVLDMRHFDVQLIGGMVLHQGQDRRDEDGRRQDARRHAAGLPERARRQGRARRHGQRLPGAPRHGVDGAALPVPRPDGRRHPARADRRRAAGRVRLRHHLRHEQRVRVRLPPRQHEVRARALRPARASLRDRRRGRQHPHRRGADAADHLRPGRGIDRAVLRGGPDHPPPEGGRGHAGRREGRGARGARGDGRLRRRREAQDGHPDRERDGEGREAARRAAAAGRPVRPGQHAAAPPHQPGAARAHASSSATSTTWSRTARSSSSTSSPGA